MICDKLLLCVVLPLRRVQSPNHFRPGSQRKGYHRCLSDVVHYAIDDLDRCFNFEESWVKSELQPPSQKGTRNVEAVPEHGIVADHDKAAGTAQTGLLPHP